MARTYNIGTECYALITTVNDPEFLLPVKIVLLEKYSMNSKTMYKVKIREIFETDIDYLKEHFWNIRVTTSLKSIGVSSLLKKSDFDTINSLSDLMVKLKDKSFYLEDNYITLDKEGLIDLYNRFVKYIINYHYTKIYQLTSRPFLNRQPIYNNQKDIFKRRVEKIGFGDMFQKYDLRLDI